MRVLSMTLLLFSLTVMGVMAQPAPAAPAITVSPRVADGSTVRQVQVIGLAPGESDVVLLLQPSGDQTAMQATADTNGSESFNVPPPPGGWQVGLYRIAVGRPDGTSISVTFAASDGQPHLFAMPNLPSPTSALNFAGIGLPPNKQLTLNLHLTGGQAGVQQIPVTTDADGTFSVFEWPEQAGLSFFAAGNYLVDIPELNLSTPFMLREHPGSAAPTVDDPVQEGANVWVYFDGYPRNSYVWGVYADSQGNVAGQFLIGEIGDSGRAQVQIKLPILAPGQYLLATPYDWGETSFTVLGPTATPTSPAATGTPVPTAAPVKVAPTPRATAKPSATARPRATAKPKATARPKTTSTKKGPAKTKGKSGHTSSHTRARGKPKTKSKHKQG